MIFDKPTYPPVAGDFFHVVSVSSSGSMPGGFRGLYVVATTSITITSRTGIQATFQDVPANTVLWISGAFVNSISATTSLIGLI